MTSFVRSAALGGAVAAAVLAGAAPAGAAAPAPELPPGAIEVAPVEIVVPRMITGSLIKMDSTEWRMSVRVPYGDLDMQSASGVAELNRRVDQAANYVCDRLEGVNPGGEPDAWTCARRAIDDARPQVAAARRR